MAAGIGQPPKDDTMGEAGVMLGGASPDNATLEDELNPIENTSFETDASPEQDDLIPPPHQ